MLPSRNSVISLDMDILCSELNSFIEDALNFYKSIRERPVMPTDLSDRIAALQEPPLNQQGMALELMLTTLKKTILPGLANTAGPRAFPWVIGGVTPAALTAAFYQILYDQINMVSGASIGPALEKETIHLLLDLFELPRTIFKGQFTTGATASNLCALAIARQWCGLHDNIDIAQSGVAHSPAIKIYSAAPHASILKSLAILGMGRDSLILAPTLANREAVDVNRLEEILSQSSAKAKIIVANAGTVNSGDFDDLASLRRLCEQYKACLDVDAAFGLFARCSTEHKALLNGIETADSITVDGHKWLNVPYDCGMLFIHQKHVHHQTAAFSSIADYMSLAADEPMNKGIENSRALRALPAWASLKAYGHQGYQELVINNCQFARAAAKVIEETNLYCLLAPVRLNIVLFKGKDIDTTEKNNRLVQAINETGKIFITATSWQGKPALRIAVCNWQTCIQLDLQVLLDALIEGMDHIEDLS